MQPLNHLIQPPMLRANDYKISRASSPRHRMEENPIENLQAPNQCLDAFSGGDLTVYSLGYIAQSFNTQTEENVDALSESLLGYQVEMDESVDHWEAPQQSAVVEGSHQQITASNVSDNTMTHTQHENSYPTDASNLVDVEEESNPDQGTLELPENASQI